MTTVLLYSGGMDSYAIERIVQPTVLLHVDMGTAYGAIETSRLHIPKKYVGDVVHVSLPLVQWERPDAIIPGRNAHLVLAAANYGDTIILGATAGDRVLDKDPDFVSRMNDLLEHLYSPQWWLPKGREVRLLTPAKFWSKRQLVAEYLNSGGDGKDLAEHSISCYNSTNETPHCGQCKPCGRKWVALICNDIDPPYDAATYVESTAWRSIVAGTWDRGEAEANDVLTALRK